MPSLFLTALAFREIMVEVPHRHAARLDDLGYGHILIAFLSNEPFGRLEDLSAGCLGLLLPLRHGATAFLLSTMISALRNLCQPESSINFS